MASIRRTLSPYQSDRSHSHHQNGNSSPFSPTNTNSPSHKHQQQPSILFPVPRKSYRRRPSLFYTCILFFLLGFLLGLAPFGQLLQQQEADVVHDFSFELNRPPTPTLDVLKQEDIVLDKVELASLQHQDSPPAPLLKQIIVVTPTYNRPLQAYYLNRLGHLLRLVPKPLLWIVVEMDLASTHTADILRGMGIMYRHLVCTKNLTNIKDRGVHQRNRALEHIEHHKLDGIVYFADDDNVYSLQLFEAIRQITRFGTWPVAMLAQSKNKATLEGPVCNGSQVIGWHTNDKSKRLRRFHVDMSGFAFNSTILWDPKRWKKPASPLIRQLDTVKEGFQETTFIEQLVEDETQMEATPLGCSKIMNWHLHLEAHELGYPKGWLLQNNLDSLLPIDYNKDR